VDKAVKASGNMNITVEGSQMGHKMIWIWRYGLPPECW